VWWFVAPVEGRAIDGQLPAEAVVWVIQETADRIGATDAAPTGWNQRPEVARRLRRRHHRGRSAEQDDRRRIARRKSDRPCATFTTLTVRRAAQSNA